MQKIVMCQIFKQTQHMDTVNTIIILSSSKMLIKIHLKWPHLHLFFEIILKTNKKIKI